MAAPAPYDLFCCNPNCNGELFNPKTDAQELANFYGRQHVQCSKCHDRWSIDLPFPVEAFAVSPITPKRS